MKKTHWLRNTITILLVCVIAGTILSVVRFNENTIPTTTATLDFLFNGAEEARFPNGQYYNVHSLITDEMLREVIAELLLENKVSAEQIRNSLSIKGIYPRGYLTQVRESKRDDWYIPTRYLITLSCEKISDLSKENIIDLMDGILAKVKNRIKKAGSLILWDEKLFSEMLLTSGYDYNKLLSYMQEELKLRITYLDEIYQANDKIFSDSESKSFQMANMRLNNIVFNDIEYLKKQIEQKGLGKNPDMTVKENEYMIQIYSDRLKGQQQYISQINNLINSYPKVGKTYIESMDSAITEVSNTSMAYNDLLAIREEATEENAKIQRHLSEKKTVLERMKPDIISNNDEDNRENSIIEEKKAEDLAQQNAQVEEEILLIQTRTNEILSEINMLLKDLNETVFNEEAIRVSRPKYNKSSILSISFIKHVIKTAGPICTIGLIFCIICVLVSQIRANKQLASMKSN